MSHFRKFRGQTENQDSLTGRPSSWQKKQGLYQYGRWMPLINKDGVRFAEFCQELIIQQMLPIIDVKACQETCGIKTSRSKASDILFCKT